MGRRRERTVNTSRPSGAEGRSSHKDLKKFSREEHSQCNPCSIETGLLPSLDLLLATPIGSWRKRQSTKGHRTGKREEESESGETNLEYLAGFCSFTV